MEGFQMKKKRLVLRRATGGQVRSLLESKKGDSNHRLRKRIKRAHQKKKKENNKGERWQRREVLGRRAGSDLRKGDWIRKTIAACNAKGEKIQSHIHFDWQLGRKSRGPKREKGFM